MDKLAQANWQRAGRRGAKRPAPISPLAQDRKRAKAQRAGDTGGRSQQEVDDMLAQMAGR